MLRKDLKPGNVFKYKGTPGVLFVGDRPEWLRGDAYQSMASECWGSWDREVEVINPDNVASVAHAHYTTGGIEAIDVIEAWGLNFRLANVVKYIARHGKKARVGAKDDLIKARTYLSREIAALEGRAAWE